MALAEKTIVKSVEITHAGTANVCWADQILRDGEVISEIPRRRAYSIEEKEAFLAEVAGAENYIAALGWA